MQRSDETDAMWRGLSALAIALPLAAAAVGVAAQNATSTPSASSQAEIFTYDSLGDFLAQIRGGKKPLVEAQGDLNLRDAAPHSIAAWFVSGNKIGEIKAGEKLRIVDAKAVVTPLEAQRWLKVEPLDAGSGGARTGWVYYGGTDYLKPVTEPK
jgi:hypothetical protein